MLWNKNELLEALSDQVLEHRLDDNLTIDEVVIDSRKTPKSGLFIALKGENNDAHDFLEQASKNGCKALLIEDKSKITNQNFLLVKNTFVALYKLAEFSRQRSKAKIIAITGSVGKTSTKEMLKLVFLALGKTFATHGNLNNHIGLPLSLCNFSADCDFGIFEMGMNHLNEIEPLSRLAKPHLAVITNVGPVHIEFFKNEEEIALAKSEIFFGLEREGIALINRDNSHFEFLKKRAEILGLKIVTFGKNSESDFCLKNSQIKDLATSDVLVSQKNKVEFSYQISTTNKIAVFNSLIATACLSLLTKDPKAGLQQLLKVENSAGRGKILEVNLSGKKITIIDDTYNASVPSIKAGLENALELKKALGKKRVVATLGDMLELGEKSVELHEEVANYLKALHIDFAALVGKNMALATDKLAKNSYKTFPDSIAASLEIQNLLSDEDILYIKGSRGMKMEKIIENLTNTSSAH